MTPRVTVSIPTYNRSGLLREALESVLTQSLEEIEVFVSDNGSTDDTPSMVASFTDPRLHYIRHETQIERHDNMSLCLRLGTAPYVTMLCDDDLMLQANLERKVQMLDAHDEVGLADSNFRIIGPNGELLRDDANFGVGETDMIMSSGEFIRRSFAETCRITTLTVLRRSIIGDECFDEADGFFCDFGLFLRLGRRVGVAFIAEPLAALRMHEAAATVQAGMADFTAGAYEQTLGKIALDQRVKKRFLAEHGQDLQQVPALRASSRRWARDELLSVIRRRTFRERRAGATARLVARACRIEPSVAFSAKAWRGLASRAVRKIS